MQMAGAGVPPSAKGVEPGSSLFYRKPLVHR